MQNLSIFPKESINRIFDLKGSTIGRMTENVFDVLTKNKFTALKDQDFIWMSEVDSKVFKLLNIYCSSLILKMMS